MGIAVGTAPSVKVGQAVTSASAKEHFPGSTIAGGVDMQQMQTLGRAVASIAHDFANTLTGIRLYSDLLFDRLDSSDPRRKHADEIRFACHYGASLIKSLLGFARCRDAEPQIICLNGVLEGLTGLLRRLISENIELEIACASDLSNVLAGPVEMQEVILNLALNARDAMPAGGRLRVSTSNLQVTRWLTERNPDIHPGPYVLLEVTDSGVGMNAETRAHLFEPFFTTKGNSGNGVGMTIVHDIVSSVGGAIEVISEVGAGTTVRVLFPALKCQARMPVARADATSVLCGSEKLLLIEDNNALRESLAVSLRQSGYSVVAAANGEEAILAATEGLREFDLVVTDLTMPGMDGNEVVRRLRRLSPTLPVLYTSGYDATPNSAEEKTAFLAKPFSMQELTHKIRELLDEGPLSQPLNLGSKIEPQEYKHVSTGSKYNRTA